MNALKLIAVEDGFINMGECENEDGIIVCFQSDGKTMKAIVVNQKGEIVQV